MTLTIAKWTIADYHDLIEQGILEDRKVELLNGEIIEMSAEGIPHAYGINSTSNYLRKLFGDRIEIRHGNPITLIASNSEPEPDLAIVKPLGKEYAQHHPYPENIFWLIEYSNSSLSKDLEVKSKIYAAAGITELWIVNLRKMELIVRRSPSSQAYESEKTFTQGQISPLAFPDMAIAVEKLL